MPSVRKQSPSAKSKKTTKTVTDRVQPVSLEDNSIHMALYGRSGTGKTTLACTFPKPLLLIGAEDGTKSVHNVKGVDFVLLENTDELTFLLGDLPSLGKTYKTVVLDSATSFQDMVLREVLELDEIPVQRSWGMAKQQDWGQVALQTKEHLRNVLGFDGNVIIIAQERDFNTEAEGDLILPTVGAALTPSVTGWLNPACDYICQTFLRPQTETKIVKVGGKSVKQTVRTGKTEFALRTGPHEIYTTKFRLPRGTSLPDAVVDPTYQKIVKLIRGG